MYFFYYAREMKKSMSRKVWLALPWLSLTRDQQLEATEATASVNF